MKLQTTILIRDTQEYPIMDDGQHSVGHMVDDFLGDQYSHGQEVHSVCVEFDTADIEMFKKMIPVRDDIEVRDEHPGKGKKFKQKLDR